MQGNKGLRTQYLCIRVAIGYVIMMSYYDFTLSTKHLLLGMKGNGG